MEIKKENIATYGLRTWEQTGTIAIDFANNLNQLSTISEINLVKYLDAGWSQVGFKFTKSLVSNTDNLELKIVLKKNDEDGESKFAYISRVIDKNDFIRLIVNVTVQIANQVDFDGDNINWKEIENLEDE